MADKRRKRKTGDAPASSYEDASSKDFHAVDISDPVTAAAGMPRRRSYANSSSGGGGSSSRGESWMTKVTAAMSHRIFSGKKLGASRSTQVMPLAGVVVTESTSGQVSKHQGSSSSAANDGTSSSTTAPVQKTQTLRQVSSENSLARITADVGAQQVTSTPVERVDFCPSVVCDITPDEEGAEETQLAVKKQQSALQSIQVRGSGSQQQRNKSNSVIEKIVPRRGYEDDSDFDSEDVSSRQRRHTNSTKSSIVSLDRDDARHVDDTSDTVPVAQDTAPILKDFFSRNASVGQGLRVQQRESRRESLYKSSKQRQERLRKRVEQETHESETQLRKLRAEQLQKLNQQRRVQLRHEAANAHKDLTTRLAGDQLSFNKERERWEGEFESEIRTLSRAFKKANAKSQPGGAGCNADEESWGGAGRPTTVAGLAVPQAMAQIRRDANNYEKRLKTATPRGSRWEWGFNDGGGGDTASQRRGSSDSSNCDIFRVENSKDEEESEADEDSFEVLYAVEDAANEDPDREPTEDQVTIHELLDERASLLQRIAQLEKLVQSQQITAGTQ